MGKDCSVITWEPRADLYLSALDDKLLAIVVDLDQSTPGSVRVYNGKEFVGMVGNTDDLTIIPWTNGWRYVCFRTQRIGEVR